MSNKPDFIVDPDGYVRDVRGQQSWQATVASPAQEQGSGFSKGRPGLPTRSPVTETRRRLYFILIPIGLIIAIIVAISRLANPHTGSYQHSSPGKTLELLGRKAFANGNNKDAIRYFSSAIAADPRFGEAYNNRGLVYSAQGDDELAFADYQKAIELLPDRAMPYNNRGTVYLRIGDYDKAYADFNKAISLDHLCAVTFFNRGLAYINQQKFDLAITDFNKAIQYTPESTVPKPISTQTASSLPRNANFLSVTYADLPMVFTYRGLAYIGQGDYVQAFQDFNKAIDLQPDLALAYYFRGAAYEASLDYARAVADFEKVLELKSDPIYQEDAKNRLEELGVK